MGYRNEEYFRPGPPEEMFIPHYFVRNGGTIEIVFECMYFETDEGYLDYISRYPHCPYENIQKLKPINLPEEGYYLALPVFDNSEYITSNARITDGEDGNIIRLVVDAHLPTIEKPVERDFTLFIIRPDSISERREEVCRGVLVILPGAPY